MKRILIVHGDKGGVGKSEAAKRIAAVMIEVGKEITLIDTDRKNPSLHLAFHKGRKDVHCIDARDSRGLEILIEKIAESPGDVLIDLGAGGSDVTKKLTAGGTNEHGFDLALLLEEIGAELHIVFVIDQSRPPLFALRDERKVLPASTKWIVVRNHREAREFELFDGSVLKTKLVEEGVPIIDMARLDPKINDILDKYALNLLSAQASDHLSMVQKIRVKSTIREWTTQMKNAGLIE